MTLLKSVLDDSFCKMLTEISNGMQGTMKRQFCRFRDSDMYNKTCLAGATINIRPRMGSFISYCGW